jgi:spore maturation protein CgeB
MNTSRWPGPKSALTTESSEFFAQDQLGSSTVDKFDRDVLYLGPKSGTCLDRANALRRLGCPVEHIDLRDLLPDSRWIDRWTWHVGGHWFSSLITKGLVRKLGHKRFRLCHVDGGEWVTPSVLKVLRKYAKRVINYNIDDPTGPRDGARFTAYRQSAALYDLLAVVREDNLPELQALGAHNVVRVYRSADEVNHAPRLLTANDRLAWASDVLFLGSWFPERGPFLRDLIRLGVPLTIRGPNWHKASEWPDLKPHWAGGSIGGDAYAMAIQCARVNLGLLSRANRDLHTTRSLEIPSLGGLLCAERTPEHTAMYDEGEEALFWSNAEECAAMCRQALADEPRRTRVAEAGHRRFKRNDHRNETVMRSLLEATEVVKALA